MTESDRLVKADGRYENVVRFKIKTMSVQPPRSLDDGGKDRGEPYGMETCQNRMRAGVAESFDCADDATLPKRREIVTATLGKPDSRPLRLPVVIAWMPGPIPSEVNEGYQTCHGSESNEQI